MNTRAHVRRPRPPRLISLLIGLCATASAALAGIPDETPALRPLHQLIDSLAEISGEVIADADGTPGSFASVIVLGTRSAVMTGESGHFLIQDLVPGKYILVVRRIGAPPYRQPIEIVCGKNPLGRILLSNCSWRASRPVAVGTFDAADLDVTIRPAKKRYHVGEPVTFEVWITNRGTQPTVLVRSVDGSDVGASPSARISIAGPAGGFVVQPFGRCGNRNAAGLDDFFEVAPGESLDPFSGGWTGAELAMGRFEKPGDYTATFHYSTTSTDPRTWMGGSSMSGRCELPAALRELLDRVPPVELTARTTFYVGW